MKSAPSLSHCIIMADVKRYRRKSKRLDFFRHTFTTLMDNAGANKESIKRIMGHASQDITDKVYTPKTLLNLKKLLISSNYLSITCKNPWVFRET